MSSYIYWGVDEEPVEGAPDQFEFGIGGYGGSQIEVRWEQGRLRYTAHHFGGGEPFEWSVMRPSASSWRKFWRSMDKVDAWNWRKDYSDHGVLDGFGWRLEVTAGDQRLATGGSNDVPPEGKMDSPEFTRLCLAIRTPLTPDFR